MRILRLALAFIALVPTIPMTQAQQILRDARTLLTNEFKIDHVTIQVEDEALRADERIMGI